MRSFKLKAKPFCKTCDKHIGGKHYACDRPKPSCETCNCLFCKDHCQCERLYGGFQTILSKHPDHKNFDHTANDCNLKSYECIPSYFWDARYYCFIHQRGGINGYLDICRDENDQEGLSDAIQMMLYPNKKHPYCLLP